MTVVVVRRAGERLQVERTLTAPCPFAAVLDDPERAGRQLAEALAAAGVREKACAVRLPPSWALSAAVELPDVPEADLQGFLELQAEREFPLPPADLTFAYSKCRPSAGKPRATLAAIPVKRMAAVHAMLQTAGRKTVSLSLGLSACTARNGSLSPGALNLWPSGRTLDLVVSAGGGVAALRSLRAASDGIANDGSIDAAHIAREVRLTLGRLPEDLRSQIREARFFGTQETAGPLMASNEAGLRALGLDSVKLYSHLSGPLESAKVPGHYLPALEVAARYLQATPAHFEFLAPKVSRAQQLVRRYASGQRQVIVGGLVVLAALLGTGAFAHSRYAARLESRWKAMQPRAEQAEAVQGRIRQFRPYFASSPRTLAIVREVTRAFPEEGSVWAKSLEVKADDTVTCAGFARSNQAFLDMLGRLRELPQVGNLLVRQVRGADPIQFTLQFTWQDGPEN